jgi:predicted RNase H-like nuclease (RuvC/YqgF family)
MEVGTWIALGALIVSIAGAFLKFLDRLRQVNKQKEEDFKKKVNADVERDSIVVRGAEGALLLMEKTLKTANEECEKRINEVEEENEALRCELTEVRAELRETKAESRKQIAELKTQIEELTRRVDNG